jgi:multidrug resistance efflux pump
VDAPKSEVVALVTGRLRSVEVVEGADVQEDQIVAWIEDSLTGSPLAMRAPEAGRVTKLDARRGENVVQGAVLATIHRLGRMEAVLEVEETKIDEVALGQTVELTFAALGVQARSRVVEIATAPLPPDPGVSERTRKIRKYAVKAPIDDPDPRLRLGVAVKGRIFTGVAP